MDWNLPVLRASLPGLAPLATALPAAPAGPPSMFSSMRAALRRVRARTATLTDLGGHDLDGTGYDVPLATPTARPPAASTLIGTVGVGSFPTAVAVSPDDRRVYVVNSNANSVSVLDARTRGPLTAITVGPRPYGIALSPDGRRAYAVNAADNSVSVIDTDACAVTATIGVGENPYAAAVSPDGDRMYVTNQGGDSVSVISTATGTVTATIGVGAGPTGVAVTPDGRRVCVVNNGAHSLWLIDTATGSVTTDITVGKHPAHVAIAPDGALAFVTNAAGGSVSIIDLSSGAIDEHILVGAHPIDVAVSPDGRWAYVGALDASRVAGAVTILGVGTGTVTTLPAGAPYGVAVSPAGDRVYVTDFIADAVSVISVGSVGERCGDEPLTAVGNGCYAFSPIEGPEHSRGQRNIRRIAVDRSACAVTADPDSGLAFVVRSDDDCVDVVEESGQTVTVDVGSHPSALVTDRDGTRAYVTNYQDGSVSVIDTAPASPSRHTVIATLDVGRSWSTGVILSRDGGRAYAVNGTDGYLSVIDTAPTSGTRDTLIGQIDLHEQPAALGLSPNGRWIYTINHFDDIVWAVHIVTNTVAAIPVPGFPYRLSVSPNGLRVYASLTDSGSMSVIDTDPASATYHRVIGRLRLGGHVPDPVFTTAGARAYVPKSGADSVLVIDTATSAVKSIAVGHYPWDVAVSQDGRRAYIANCLDNSVSIVDSASDTVTGTVTVGTYPCRIAVSADGSRALVANNRDDSVSVIDTAAALVSTTIPLGRNPFDVTLSRDGARACIHHRDGLSVLSL